MIVKSVVTGCLGPAALIAVAEKAQRGEAALQRFGPREPAAFNRHRITRQRESDYRDTDRRIRTRVVRDEAIGRIYRLGEVVERGALQPVQQSIVGCLERWSHMRSYAFFDDDTAGQARVSISSHRKRRRALLTRFSEPILR